MATLKEQFQKKKQIEELKRLVEAKKIIEENCILVEDLNQEKLNAMADAISKLDAVISNPQIAAKVPTLKKAIDAATKEIQDFITNKVSLRNIANIITKDKAFNPINKSMALFSGLSTFFTGNLPKILQAFKLTQANMQEDVGQDMVVPVSKKLQPADTKRFQAMVQRGLQTGGLLGFFGRSLPYIDATAVARELTSLTPAELNSVATSINRIQMPITPDIKNDLIQMAKGAVPQDVQNLAAQQQNQPTNKAETDINTAFNNLKSFNDNQILDIIKGSNSIKDMLNKIGQFKTQSQPQQAQPQQTQQVAQAPVITSRRRSKIPGQFKR